MGRHMIVGRQQIVGYGHHGHHGHGGADYDELMEFGTGADAPPPPPMLAAHPMAPMPGAPFAHPQHPAAHPAHPHHAAWWHHQQYGGGYPAGPGYAAQPYGRHHPRGVPWAYQRSQNGPTAIDEHPTHTREFPIGFVAFALPGGGAQTGIEQKPQVLFRGERLAVPASIVGDFDMSDIKVGKDSQLAAPGNMPAECFSNLSVGVRMQLDSAEPGITITLFVQNNAGPDSPQDFKSVLYGTVIE